MKPLLSFLLLPLAIKTAMAVGYNPPPRNKVDPHVVDNFTWVDPFHSRTLRHFRPTCTAEKTFSAWEYQLHDLNVKEPLGLWSYSHALKKIFINRHYPGGWHGIDPHHHERPLLMMEYDHLPLKVREWVENQERTQGKWHGLFAVYERQDPNTRVEDTVIPPSLDEVTKARELDNKKVVIFAPGALYENLPLWVAEGSDCPDVLFDLAKYTPEPWDGGVIAWTTKHTRPHRKKDQRDAQFTIKAQWLETKEEVEAKDEL